MSPHRSSVPIHDRGEVAGWFLYAISLAVPAHQRSEWLSEWRSELWHLRSHQPHPFAYAHFQNWSLLRGMLADALWLCLDDIRRDREADSRRGSASWCLKMLGVVIGVCFLLECALAGSWHAMLSATALHFYGCFAYVILPASVIALTTSNLRPRKCDRKRSRLSGLLSANFRWNLFLSAKLLLTLVWGFLLSADITLLARMAIGHYADWVELLSTALIAILGLRWALLNQERRCQHCLRMLSEPTRVGFASRNFLDWNGMELYCAEGHGLLHITEMEGSWCWYDLWVELDPTWHTLFSA